MAVPSFVSDSKFAVDASHNTTALFLVLIIASRGAVRMPLPMRSAVTTAAIPAAPEANSRKTSATAESP